MKNPQENLIQDTTSPEKLNKKVGFEMSEDEGSKKLVESLEIVSDLINHDRPIKVGDMEKAENLCGGLMIDIGGELMTVEEVEQIPDLEDQIKLRDLIKEKIKNGENLNSIVGGIKFLSPIVAEALSDYGAALFLNMKSLSAKSAEQLAKHKKGYHSTLWLTELSEISELTAEHLGNHHNRLVIGLDNLPDDVAEKLSHHEDSLEIRKLSSITETAAKHLSKLRGGLNLARLSHISDEVARNLCLVGGLLTLNNKDKIPPSDESLKYLASHKGDLTLHNLGRLSDLGAEYFSKHEGDLYLDIDFISEKGAEMIAKHKGQLSIGYLREYTDKTIRILKQHPDIMGGIMKDGSSKSFRDL